MSTTGQPEHPVWAPAVARRYGSAMVATRLQGENLLPRLLVVEDDRGTRVALERYFSAHRFEVSAASSGDDALALFEAEQFDAVVLDLRLPRIGGEELVQRMRASEGARRATPIVVTTGVPEVAVPGVQATLTKPVSLAALLEQVERLIPPGERS